MEPSTFTAEAPLPEDALICGFAVPPQGPNRELRPADLAEAPSEGVTWLHFRLSNARAEALLAGSALLPAGLRERIREHDERAAIQVEDGGLVVVASDLRYEGPDDLSDTATLWAYATPQRLLTARSHALHSSDALRLALRQGLKTGTGYELLTFVLEQRGETLARILALQNDRVDDIEDEILRGNITEQRERLGRVRRLCARVRRLFLPERTALRKLLAAPPACLPAGDAERLRGVVESLSYLVDDANELYERAKLLQEELASRLAENTSDRLYVLSVLSAVLLPMTLVTGVFGMNVAGLPGLHGEGSFFWTMVLIVLAGGLTLGVLRWKRLL